MNQYQIFISHFGQEKAVAEAIQKTLRKAFAGHARVFVSSDVPRGENWLTEIRTKLIESDEILTVFSYKSAERPWLNIETGFGVMSGKPVTPILFGGLQVGDLSLVYALHQAVDWQKQSEVVRLYADIHSRVRRKKNEDAECLWDSGRFWKEWQTSVKKAAAQVPASPRRTNEHPVIWLIGSHGDLHECHQSVALQVCQVIAAVCIANRIQIVSGTSRMLEYLADEYENYRDHFKRHPEMLAEVPGEPVRKVIATEHALHPFAAPNPVILLGSLRHKSVRTTFDDAIGRFPDMSIVVGGGSATRSPVELDLAREAGIPILPIQFTGGAAAETRPTMGLKLKKKVEKLQRSKGKMDEFGRVLLEIINEQAGMALADTRNSTVHA